MNTWIVEPLSLGWFCRNPSCGVFNGDEKEFLLACRACASGRPQGKGVPSRLDAVKLGLMGRQSVIDHLRKVEDELILAYANLGGVQKRCSELLTENRTLRAARATEPGDR